MTLANERTFLAWSRTALALVAAGLAIVQLLPPFPGVVAGAIVLALSVPVWAAARRIRRSGAAESAASGLRLVTLIIVLIAAAALVVALTGHPPDSLAQLLHGR